ncbi:MAG: uridine kinase [Bacteroidota bacterium]
MKPYIVGITGGSGSGKTSFIDRIRQAFTEEELCVVSQDNYYLPIEMQAKDRNGIENFDLPSSFDHDSFHEDMLLLISGKDVTKDEYIFNDPTAIPKKITFHSAPIILIEGLYVFHTKPMRDLIDLKVFVHAKDEYKIIRRIIRDQTERNYPVEDVLYRYQHHVMPNFEQYIKPHLDKVDLIVNNNDHFEQAFKVLQGFLRNHLRDYRVKM